MGRLSDKIKLIYLALVILFALAVFVYLLDTWGIIRLERFLPYLKQDPPIVELSNDDPTELEKERLRKEEARLADEELRLKELEASLQTRGEEIEEKQRKIDELRKGIEERQQLLDEARAKEADRKAMIGNMARRIYSMPPDDSIAIVAGWSNTDLVDVFLQMEKNAADEGTSSIVPYLMTKLPRDRAAVITTMMMDAEARASLR
jgi:flagellar protein FlbB